MMSRRRALLIRSALNSAPKPYEVRVITSLLIHQSTSENGYTPWYTGDTYEFNESSSLFTLTDGSMYPLRYSTASAFNTQFMENYCISQAASGSIMYFFMQGCIASSAFDEATGMYSITIHGKIKVYTPITSQ